MEKNKYKTKIKFCQSSRSCPNSYTFSNRPVSNNGFY